MTDIPAPVDGPLRDSFTLTVTLFGDHDEIDQAISEELGRRGCRTHSVSVQTGWLMSTTVAILRLDTAAGASALEGLCAASGPCAHIIAICEEPVDPHELERLHGMCEECGSTHAVSLIRHGSLGPASQPDVGTADPPARHLALVVVDEVANGVHTETLPSFTTRSIA